MKFGLVLCGVLLAFACKKKDDGSGGTAGSAQPAGSAMGSATSESPPAAGSSAAGSAAGSGAAGSADMGSGAGSAAGSAAGSGSAATQQAGAATLGPIVAAPSMDTPSDLPSADLLPVGERIGGAVVVGDGYRFQVGLDARRTTQDGQTAYVGADDALVPPVAVAHWVTVEKFPGTIDALVEREKKAVVAAGAKEPADIKSVRGHLAGKIVQGMSRQMLVDAKDRIDVVTMTVQNGKAYILHCAATNIEAARFPVTSDCPARGQTLHINPPPLKKK